MYYFIHLHYDPKLLDYKALVKSPVSKSSKSSTHVVLEVRVHKCVF